jgi:metallo-beta-lactamase family protein
MYQVVVATERAQWTSSYEQEGNMALLSFLGAIQQVTGSCYLLETHDGARVLLECGMHQGRRQEENDNRAPFAFDPKTLDAVVLSHAHIDHSGLLPRLAAAGYEGPIHCTAATRDLLQPMLADAGRIQESEAERRNRRADRADEERIAPLYTEADALAACGLARAIGYRQWFEPAPGVRARLWNAGPILGSASVELEIEGLHRLFRNPAFHYVGSAAIDAPQ